MRKLKVKLLVALSLLPALFLSSTSYAEEAYVRMDAQLKKIISQNANSTSMMNLYNFAEKKSERLDIYQVTSEEGLEFIPQDEMTMLVYNKFIEGNFLPIIAILETNKIFLESRDESVK